MLFPLSKKTVFVLVLIFTTAAIAFNLFAQKDEPLLAYVPKKSEFWLLQNKNGHSDKLVPFVSFLGVSHEIQEALKTYKNEALIYRNQGQWARATSLQQRRTLDQSLMNFLSQTQAASVVGYVSAPYAANMLQNRLPLQLDGKSGYYFALKANTDLIEFVIIKESELALFNYPSFETVASYEEILFVLKTEDAVLRDGVRDLLKSKIAYKNALSYPVIRDTELPDRTFMKEKVIDPEFFTWINIQPNYYELTPGSDIEEWKNDSALAYYEEENTIVFGPIGSYQKLYEQYQKARSIKGLFFINLALPLNYDDILDYYFLRQLRELGAKSIMVEENDGWAEGVIKLR